MIENVLLAFTPMLVSLLTEYTKNLKPVNAATKPVRAALLRLLVAGLSYGAVIGNSALTGEPIDAASVETIATTAIIAISTTVTYLLGKGK